MFLSPDKLAYQTIQSASTSSVTFVIVDDMTSPPTTTPPLEPLDQLLPMNEAIREIMSFGE